MEVKHQEERREESGEERFCDRRESRGHPDGSGNNNGEKRGDGARGEGDDGRKWGRDHVLRMRMDVGSYFESRGNGCKETGVWMRERIIILSHAREFVEGVGRRVPRKKIFLWCGDRCSRNRERWV